MTDYTSIILKVVTLLSAIVITSSAMGSDFSMISSNAHEPVRAEIVKDDANDFIINVKFIANLGDDADTATFAIYTISNEPEKCADFRNLNVPYKEPTEYEREFDLTNHPEVIKALRDHSCVVITNTRK